MSCQINNIAYISIVDKVKSKLGLIERSEQPTSGDDDEDNWDWDWQEASTSSAASTQSSSSSKDSQWLQQCCISLSPTGKVLALAHEKQIVILNAYLDAREQNRETRTEYNIVSHANICEPGEEITSVLCVPLLSQLKSSPSGTDWTCIVVGFSSGYVRFYTEDKKLLAGEQFHGEPVSHLKCQSFRRASHSAASEQAEELYVVYPTCVTTLPGFSLFQTLRACRNQLARVHASGSGSIDAPPLAHSKWGFPDQEMINDCQVVGSTSVNTFDHLMTASICGGFDAVVKSSAPAHSLVIASGRKPYVGYHYTFEGNSQPILLGVARAMANTIKSSQGLLAIKSYFTGSKTPKEKKPVSTIDPAEPMGCRFGLCDLWRQGEHIVPAPNRLLSVVCDSLGRVILLDTHFGTVLRMWKGYRDAQCAWIEVKEPLSRTSPAAASARTKHRPRVALFLVVYAPKKGIIEVWAMQQGPKVASFSVSKGGRLLYTNYGHVGVNNVPVKGSSRSQLPCIYVDTNGALREIVVPFHFSLSAQNSKQARDMHLLKKLRQLLRDCRNEEVAGSAEEVGRLVHDLWGSEAGLQALDVLTGSKNTKPSHMLAALNSLISKLDSQDPEEMDLGSKTLQHTCKQLLNLVNFFVFLEEQNSEPPTYESVVTTKNATAQELATELLTPEKEMEYFLNLVSEIASIIKETTAQPRVKFQDDAQSMFIEFLSCFETSSLNANLQCPVAIKQDIPEENLKRTSLQIFQGWLKSDGNFDEWLSQAQTSGIQAQTFLRLSLHFWLQFHQNDSSAFATVGAEMLIFGQLLKGICSLAGNDFNSPICRNKALLLNYFADKDEISVDCNDLSVWWQVPRNILTNSDRPLRALTAAIVCRGVGLYLEKCKERKDDAKEAENAEEAMEVDGEVPTNTDWEQVSMDTMQWNALSRHLEDLALLDAVLQVKLKTKLRCLPHCLKWKPARQR
ncbi:hypothetical protein B566_EDAN002570 [Ephemera danica]|nr:hypothetical protein B566_EDAN002570 [Ephemera danica]